jgi:folate-dependent phosphoribosylglycinamide formyltransferase PurN
LKPPASPPTGRALRAFVLGAPTPLAAGLTYEWLRAGNRIAGIYCAQRGSSPGRLRHDARLGRYSPQLSLSAIASHCGIELNFISTSQSWDRLQLEIERQDPDIILSLMFLARIPARIIAVARGRLLNIHPALLPAYPGLSSLSSMQYDGTAAEYAGLTLHVVTEEFDAGPIVSQIAVPPPETGNFADHLHGLISAGEVLVRALPAYLAGEIKPVPQDCEAPQRRSHALSEIVIRPLHSAIEIIRIFRTGGPLHKLAVEGLSPSLKVDGFLCRLGPAQLQPPQVGWRGIELDLADCRVRLRRASRFRDKIRKMMMIRKLVRLSDRRQQSLKDSAKSLHGTE